jgi:hypothetical protein
MKFVKSIIESITDEWIICILAVIYGIILSIIFFISHFSIDGIKALLPNYITISTVILAVTFAAVAINDKKFLDEQI